MMRSPFERAIVSLRRQGIKYDLERMRALDERLGHPHRAYVTLHVTGTNGKGSTSAFLASMLQAAGYRVGLNTSPHLVSFRERVRVDARAVSDEALLSWFDEARPVFDDVEATFFEATTALAMLAFRAMDVDVAVFEVGLGGRLDASNIIESAGSIITGIELEHTRILGDTHEAIAREKAGILRAHPSVSGIDHPGAAEVVRNIARTRGTDLRFLSEGIDWHFDDGALVLPSFRVVPGLPGRHQAENAALADALLAAVDHAGSLSVPLEARERGIRSVVWPGRFDRRTIDDGEVIFDVAHNAGGARVVGEELERLGAGPVPAVIGMLRDKAHDPFLEALRPSVSHVVATTPASETRALDADVLAERARAAGYTSVDVEPDPARATRLAARTARERDVPALVTGSLFTVGGAMDGLGIDPASAPAGYGAAREAGSTT